MSDSDQSMPNLFTNVDTATSSGLVNTSNDPINVNATTDTATQQPVDNVSCNPITTTSKDSISDKSLPSTELCPNVSARLIDSPSIPSQDEDIAISEQSNKPQLQPLVPSQVSSQDGHSVSTVPQVSGGSIATPLVPTSDTPQQDTAINPSTEKSAATIMPPSTQSPASVGQTAVPQQQQTTMSIKPQSSLPAASTVPSLQSPQPLSVTTTDLKPSTSATTAPTAMPHLTQSDASILALLQSNLPQLNQMRENLRNLIQSSLLLQTLKTAATNTVIPTQTPNTVKQQPSKATPSGGTTAAPLTSSVPGVGSNLQKIVSVAESVVSTINKGTSNASASLPSATGSSSRKPVLAQVIGKTTQNELTPLSNTKQLLSPSTKTPGSKLANIPLAKPITKGSTISKLSSSPLKSKFGSKIVEKELNFSGSLTPHTSGASPLSMLFGDKDVIEPIEQEPAFIDVVGETPPPLDLPPHLKDHTYCIYNPTVQATPRSVPEVIPTIPQERLSYAPEIPDSPRTLYKLLKVLPKKSNGSCSSSTIKSKTNSVKYTNTPSTKPLR